jgi:hypothetical protein
VERASDTYQGRQRHHERINPNFKSFGLNEYDSQHQVRENSRVSSYMPHQERNTTVEHDSIKDSMIQFSPLRK